MVPKASLQAIIGVVHLMKYNKRELNLEQYRCENLKSRMAREVSFVSVYKTKLTNIRSCICSAAVLWKGHILCVTNEHQNEGEK
jgi:hypothetical protein